MKWPEIRAGLIALAIGLGMVEGCPLPPADHTPAWEAGLLAPVRAVRRVVLAPVAWITPTVRVTQRFNVFQAADPERFRFEIEGQDRTGWHLIYRAGDAEHDAYDELLRYRRVIGAWEPIDAPPAPYGAFGAWFARILFAAQPELIAVRYRFAKIVLDPGAPRDTGETVFPLVVVRR